MLESNPLIRPICHAPSPVYYSAELNNGFSIQLRHWCHLMDKTKIFVLSDSNVSDLWLERFRHYLPFNDSVQKIIIPPGETSKSIESAALIWDIFHKANANRNSILINLGGGVISDLGGYAASTYKRGLQMVNIPTSLLAMTDAALGGKNALNFQNVKNQIGTFYQPKFTWIVKEFLSSLPQEEYISGLAEIFKQAMIDNLGAFNAMLRLKSDISMLKDGMIKAAAKFKMKTVLADPRDQGKRHILNFGHTIGHAIEAYMSSIHAPVTHGKAVAWGMMVALELSSSKLGFSNKHKNAAIDWILAIYGPFPKIDIDEILRLCLHDKKNNSPEIRMILLPNIGQYKFVNLSLYEIGQAIEKYAN